MTIRNIILIIALATAATALYAAMIREAIEPQKLVQQVKSCDRDKMRVAQQTAEQLARACYGDK
jgi:hypothetical protein